MEIGALVFFGLAVLCLAVPVGILMWVRSATMFSGRSSHYDGPSGEVMQGDAVEEESIEGLSGREKAAWDELTRVTWNLPERQK